MNRTVLHTVAERNYWNHKDRSRPHVIDLWIQNGADIMCKDKVTHSLFEQRRFRYMTTRKSQRSFDSITFVIKVQLSYSAVCDLR